MCDNWELAGGKMIILHYANQDHTVNLRQVI